MRDDHPDPGADAHVARARLGDPDAWELLYRRAYPQLLAYARRRVQDRADDVVSETMSRAIAGIDSFTWSDASFDAWLVGICRNVCREHWRTEGRTTPGDAVGEGAAADQPTLDDAAVLGERTAALLDAFAVLSPEDREVLELRVVHGLSAADVGRVLGKGAGAVRMSQSRALERLRVEMGRLGHVDA